MLFPKNNSSVTIINNTIIQSPPRYVHPILPLLLQMMMYDDFEVENAGHWPWGQNLEQDRGRVTAIKKVDLKELTLEYER